MEIMTGKKFAAELKKIHAEGQGVWDLMMCSPDNMPYMFTEAIMEDGPARRMMDAITNSLQQIAEAPPARPKLCLTCPTAFKKGTLPLAFVMVHAHHHAPTSAICNGICEACYDRHRDKLLNVVIDFYRENIVTDLQQLPPMSEPGHA
jgi:hypothetical protein